MIRDDDDAKFDGVLQIRRKTAMATQERGVYQPQEDFASYEDYPEEEGRSRLPLMIVIALVVLAAFGGVVWLAYNQGVAHGRAGAPPIVAAPAGPARTPPDETQTASGGATTPYTGLKVYGEPVPPDEEAAGSALAPQTSPDLTAPVPVAPAPQVTAEASPESQMRLTPETAVPAPVHAPAPPVAHTPTPTPAMPEIVVATPEPSHVPSTVTVATPAPRAHPPTTTTTTTTTASASHAPTPIAPEPQVTAAPAPLPEPPPPTQVATDVAPPPAHTGGAALRGKAVLQIGSYPSATAANGAWKSFQRSHSGVLTGLSSDVMAAQIPGKGTWYRLRIGPFADRAAANAKCAKLKAQGATCLVAAP